MGRSYKFIISRSSRVNETSLRTVVACIQLNFCGSTAPLSEVYNDYCRNCWDMDREWLSDYPSGCDTSWVFHKFFSVANCCNHQHHAFREDSTQADTYYPIFVSDFCAGFMPLRVIFGYLTCTLLARFLLPHLHASCTLPATSPARFLHASFYSFAEPQKGSYASTFLYLMVTSSY